MVLLKTELIWFSVNKCLAARSQGRFFTLYTLKHPHLSITRLGNSIMYQNSPRILLETTPFSKVSAHQAFSPALEYAYEIAVTNSKLPKPESFKS